MGTVGCVCSTGLVVGCEAPSVRTTTVVNGCISSENQYSIDEVHYIAVWLLFHICVNWKRKWLNWRHLMAWTGSNLLIAKSWEDKLRPILWLVLCSKHSTTQPTTVLDVIDYKIGGRCFQDKEGLTTSSQWCDTTSAPNCLQTSRWCIRPWVLCGACLEGQRTALNDQCI